MFAAQEKVRPNLMHSGYDSTQNVQYTTGFQHDCGG